MNSASQSQSAEASGLLADVDRWDRAGWRLASPVWFVLLCAGASILASVPVAVLVDGDRGVVVYWSVVAPLTAIASAWYFQTRGATPPPQAGVAILLTGMAMLVAVLAVIWFGSGPQGLVTPWVVIGVGFALFALAWRSWTVAAVAVASLGTIAVASLADLGHGDVLVALVVGVVAIGGTFVELLRESPVPAA